MKKDLMRSIALVVGGVCIGSGTTYLIVEKRLRTKYQQFADDEIKEIRRASREANEAAKEHYKLLRKEPPYDDPRTAVKAYNERLDQLQYWSDNGVPEDSANDSPIHDELAEERVLEAAEEAARQEGEVFVEKLLTGATEAVNHDVFPPSQAQRIVTLEDVAASPADIPETNIFERFPEDSIPAESLRDKTMPYIISESEFHTNLESYEQVVLLWYSDEILADEKGKQVANIKSVLGKGTLKHFGHDEANPNTLYVRNDVLKADYEVVRLETSYGEDVMGIAPKD